MRTERVVLRIGQADGTIRETPMRYNGLHQRGYRCFIGGLADAPGEIKEDTPPSFDGRRLFDALAEYRKTIEPGGWRLLHAAARGDCWPKPDELGPFVEQLTFGKEQTQRVGAFEPAEFAIVATLAAQQSGFESWIKSLTPVPMGRIRPRAGHEHDEAKVDFGPLTQLAGRILSERPD